MRPRLLPSLLLTLLTAHPALAGGYKGEAAGVVVLVLTSPLWVPVVIWSLLILFRRRPPRKRVLVLASLLGLEALGAFRIAAADELRSTEPLVLFGAGAGVLALGLLFRLLAGHTQH